MLPGYGGVALFCGGSDARSFNEMYFERLASSMLTCACEGKLTYSMKSTVSRRLGLPFEIKELAWLMDKVGGVKLKPRKGKLMGIDFLFRSGKERWMRRKEKGLKEAIDDEHEPNTLHHHLMSLKER